jgi:hypothetical protein
MSARIQWTQPPASGSSTTIAKASVPSGAPDQARGGETSSASQVCLAGIGPPSAKALLVTIMLVAPVVGVSLPGAHAVAIKATVMLAAHARDLGAPIVTLPLALRPWRQPPGGL